MFLLHPFQVRWIKEWYRLKVWEEENLPDWQSWLEKHFGVHIASLIHNIPTDENYKGF